MLQGPFDVVQLRIKVKFERMYAAKYPDGTNKWFQGLIRNVFPEPLSHKRLNALLCPTNHSYTCSIC